MHASLLVASDFMSVECVIPITAPNKFSRGRLSIKVRSVDCTRAAWLGQSMALGGSIFPWQNRRAKT